MSDESWLHYTLFPMSDLILMDLDNGLIIAFVVLDVWYSDSLESVGYAARQRSQWQHPSQQHVGYNLWVI